MTLIEFIKARLADDERSLDDVFWYTEPDGTRIRPRDTNVPDESVEDAKERIFRRPLAECRAKRMLVEDHSGHHVCEDNMAGTVWDEKTEDIVEDPCRVLRIIGSIYADHPDYRTEWEVQP